MTAHSTPAGRESRTRHSLSTEMSDAIVLVIHGIPAGQVASYGQVAAMAGFPGRARLVGRILGNLPEATRLPWHRVVNSQGKLSLSHERGHEQQQRLHNEGVILHNDKVAKHYFWLG